MVRIEKMTADELVAYHKNLELAGRFNPEVVRSQIEAVDREIADRKRERTSRLRATVEGIGFCALLIAGGVFAALVEG